MKKKFLTILVFSLFLAGTVAAQETDSYEQGFEANWTFPSDGKLEPVQKAFAFDGEWVIETRDNGSQAEMRYNHSLNTGQPVNISQGFNMTTYFRASNSFSDDFLDYGLEKETGELGGAGTSVFVRFDTVGKDITLISNEEGIGQVDSNALTFSNGTTYNWDQSEGHFITLQFRGNGSARLKGNTPDGILYSKWTQTPSVKEYPYVTMVNSISYNIFLDDTTYSQVDVNETQDGQAPGEPSSAIGKLVSDLIDFIIQFFQDIISQVDSGLSDGEKTFTAIIITLIFTVITTLVTSEIIGISTFISGLVGFTAAGWLPSWIGFSIVTISIAITLYAISKTLRGG